MPPSRSLVEIRLVGQETKELPGGIFAVHANYEVSFHAPQQDVRDSFRLFVPGSPADSTPPSLTVHWSVKGPYDIEPSRIVVSRLGEDVVERSLTLRRVDGQPFAISEVRVTSESITCQPETSEGMAIIKIRIDPQRIERFLVAELRIETTDPGFPSVVVPVVVSR